MGNEASRNDPKPKATSNDNCNSKQQKEERKKKKRTTGIRICEQSKHLHCCNLELFVPERDEWIQVWPLIKYDNNDGHNDNDNKDNDDEYYAGKNSKLLYLFNNKTDRDNETMKNAIKILEIAHGLYSIYEHYPVGIAKEPDECKYCVITNSKDSKYTFKCKDNNHRRVFIDALIETMYFKKTNCLNKIYRLNKKDHFQHEYKYQSIWYITVKV